MLAKGWRSSGADWCSGMPAIWPNYYCRPKSSSSISNKWLHDEMQ